MRQLLNASTTPSGCMRTVDALPALTAPTRAAERTRTTKPAAWTLTKALGARQQEGGIGLRQEEIASPRASYAARTVALREFGGGESMVVRKYIQSACPIALSEIHLEMILI
jgi:hypothetical protein